MEITTSSSQVKQLAKEALKALETHPNERVAQRMRVNTLREAAIKLHGIDKDALITLDLEDFTALTSYPRFG